MPEYLKRARLERETTSSQIRETVSEVLLAVEREGEAAVRRYSQAFDDWSPPSFVLSEEDIATGIAAVDDELKSHIAFAQEQISNFARLQLDSMHEFEQETLPGVVLGQRHVPVNAVGSYAPGGRYPILASANMTILVPKVAGVGRVVAAAPPQPGGGIHPAQLYAMATSGADQILCLGGIQALAAMAFGIEGVEPVDMVVGAGNAYVAEAKRQLFGRVGIDLLAGPTEILVIADDSADPELIAADLLGQAEHGPTSPAVLVTTSRDVGEATIAAVDRWLETWPTAPVAAQAWRGFGVVVVCDSLEEAAATADAFAPEHLEVHTTDPDWFLARLNELRHAVSRRGGNRRLLRQGDRDESRTAHRRSSALYRGPLGGEVLEDAHVPACHAGGNQGGSPVGSGDRGSGGYGWTCADSQDQARRGRSLDQQVQRQPFALAEQPQCEPLLRAPEPDVRLWRRCFSAEARPGLRPH